MTLGHWIPSYFEYVHNVKPENKIELSGTVTPPIFTTGRTVVLRKVRFEKSGAQSELEHEFHPSLIDGGTAPKPVV